MFLTVSHEQITKEQAFMAKSEAANAKKSLAGTGKGKEPHWMAHVEPPPSILKADKADEPAAKPEKAEGEPLAWSVSGQLVTLAPP